MDKIEAPLTSNLDNVINRFEYLSKNPNETLDKNEVETLLHFFQDYKVMERIFFRKADTLIKK